MTGALYLRSATVTLGPVEVPSLPDDDSRRFRIAFAVDKNPYATQPNHAAVQISNLSQRTRDALSVTIDPEQVKVQPGLATCTIEAGYLGVGGQPASTGVIFRGKVTNLTHTRRGADWVTEVIAGDGVDSGDARISQTFAPNLDLKLIVTQMVTKLKEQFQSVDISQVIARLSAADWAGAADIVFAKPFAVEGPIKRTLDSILRPRGFELSEQDGGLVLLSVDEVLPGQAILLSAGTGLVGTVDPIRDDQLPNAHVIRGRSLLRHEMRIGGAVQLDSAVEKGLFKVRRLRFRGDTHGRDWHVEFTGVEVRGA